MATNNNLLQPGLFPPGAGEREGGFTITHVTDASGNVVSEYSFDAWGRHRDKDDWSYSLSGEPALFADRGFTGHEWLPWFNLYNMNGRLYDPVVGRFLSPDPYVANQTSTQEYNRYSYCLNNPLKYIDPSGYKKAEKPKPNIIVNPDWLKYAYPNRGYGGYNSGVEGMGYGIGSNGTGGGGYHSYVNSLIPSLQEVKPGFNIDNAVNYLNGHAYPKYDKATCGKCAKAVRLSLEAGGIDTSDRNADPKDPTSQYHAKNWGSYLLIKGFGVEDISDYSAEKGDIRVFQNYPGGSFSGHIDMYNGNQWVSDYFENGFWPGRGYRENNAAFTIYRWGD